jgi:hypothetical protein
LLDAELKSLSQKGDDESIFNPDKGGHFTYSNQYHGNNVSIVSPTKIKSISSTEYRFCLLEPSISTNTKTKFAFSYSKTVDTGGSWGTWIAVGMASEKLVKAGNYKF